MSFGEPRLVSGSLTSHGWTDGLRPQPAFTFPFSLVERAVLHFHYFILWMSPVCICFYCIDWGASDVLEGGRGWREFQWASGTTQRWESNTSAGKWSDREWNQNQAHLSRTRVSYDKYIWLYIHTIYIYNVLFDEYFLKMSKNIQHTYIQ